MPVKESHKTILNVNKNSATTSKVSNPVGVFIGGTSGVGEGADYAFARYTKNATIYLVGRNKVAAKEIVKKLKEIQPTGDFKFVQCDLTLVKNAKSVAEQIASDESKINVLSLTCGVINFSTEKKTEEGFDKRRAVGYYSRWMIADQLAPLLANAAKAGEPARVHTIMNPDRMDIIDSEYIKTPTSGFQDELTWDCRMNNLSVEKYGKLYPDVTFMHTYPGVVKSGLMRKSPWYIRCLAQPMLFLVAESNESCGERMHYLNYACDQVTTGSHYYDGKLHDLRDKFVRAGYLSEQSQEDGYNHLRQILDRFN